MSANIERKKEIDNFNVLFKKHVDVERKRSNLLLLLTLIAGLVTVVLPYTIWSLVVWFSCGVFLMFIFTHWSWTSIYYRAWKKADQEIGNGR